MFNLFGFFYALLLFFFTNTYVKSFLCFISDKLIKGKTLERIWQKNQGGLTLILYLLEASFFLENFYYITVPPPLQTAQV